MSLEFNKCFKRGKLKKFSRGPALISKELKNSEMDLAIAQKSFADKNYKWATIQVYYSMFHSARALIYSKSYREKSHYCLIEAIRFLFVDKKELNYKIIEAFQKAKALREDADYYGDFNKSNAKVLIIEASSFLKITKNILQK